MSIQKTAITAQPISHAAIMSRQSMAPAVPPSVLGSPEYKGFLNAAVGQFLGPRGIGNMTITVDGPQGEGAAKHVG